MILEDSWGYLMILGDSWGFLGIFLMILEDFWGFFDDSWGFLGIFLMILGDSWGFLMILRRFPCRKKGTGWGLPNLPDNFGVQAHFGDRK